LVDRSENDDIPLSIIFVVLTTVRVILEASRSHFNTRREAEGSQGCGGLHRWRFIPLFPFSKKNLHNLNSSEGNNIALLLKTGVREIPSNLIILLIVFDK
jgi:hypothetical protein